MLFSARLPDLIAPGGGSGAIGAGGDLTYKGHGTQIVAGGGGNYTLSYGAVLGGEAPVAGDLVVWVVDWINYGGGDDPNTLTGWTAATDYLAIGFGYQIWSGAKVLVAGDLSTPANLITSLGAFSGTAGMWVAYSVTGTISSMSATSPMGTDGNSSAPANLNDIDSSALNPPSTAITWVVAHGNDDAVTVGGVTFDTAQQVNNVGYGNALDLFFGQKLDVGGANLTITGVDNGSDNALIAGYITVNFA